MEQIIYAGTDGDDLLDASSLAAGTFAAFRAVGGNDTLIGSDANDRFDGGEGADSMFGSGGNDQFFISLNNTPGDPRDSIDGGQGTDQLVIILSDYQLTAANKAEILSLKEYLDAHDSSAHFISDILHLDLTGVETALLKVDGVNMTLGSIANDPASISGTHAAAIDAYGLLSASGQLAVTDADAGEAKFQAPTDEALHTAYGTFTFDADSGNWGYAVSASAAQSIGFGQMVTDTLHVVSADGTASQDITVSIHGGGTTDYAVNGGFEAPHLDTYYGAVQHPGSIDGWTTAGNTIEMWQNANGVTASEGSQFVELDDDGAYDALSQTLDLVAGQSYVISIDAMARTNEGLTNAFDVIWNGTTVGQVNPEYNVWHSYRFVVTAQAGQDKLTLAELAAYNDAYGPLIDNVQIHDALWA